MKRSQLYLLSVILFSIFLIGTVSADTCYNERGNPYYCEKISRYSNNFYDYDCRYDYYTNDRYYYDNYRCDDYKCDNDIRDCDYNSCYNDNPCSYGSYDYGLRYRDKFGNYVTEYRPTYTQDCDYTYDYRWHDYGYRPCNYNQDYNPYYPDYYRVQYTSPVTTDDYSQVYVM